jgi:5-methylcytosine-specific restriction enzyme A
MTRLRSVGRKLQPSSPGKLRLPAKRAASIYHTPEYQAWRAAVIERAAGRCEQPGCGRREPRMFADHVIELRDGGAPFDLVNGQCLCGSCHTAKTAAARAARHAR